MEWLFRSRVKDKQSEKKFENEDFNQDCDEEITGLSQLYCPQQDNVAKVRDVADVLLEMGKISDNQLSKIRETHKKRVRL